ncbi:molybdate transporter 2 [Tanacetum coccineum]
MDEESSSSPPPQQPLLNHHQNHSDHPPWHTRIRTNITTSLTLHKTTIWSELGGSVGDLGTYIPIVLALTLVSKLDLSTTLIFTALYNITTGLLFGIPMPVQPMKSIASVAISEQPLLTLSQIAAAGICTATVLLLLGGTGLMSWLYRYIPLPVVRGVQLSQGLSFAFTAIKYVRYEQDFAKNQQGGDRRWFGYDGVVVALTAVVFLVVTTGAGESYDEEGRVRVRVRVRRRLKMMSSIPSALIVFLLGIVLCFVIDPSIFWDLKFGPSKFHVLTITWDDFKTGFLRGAVPQIPLSVLNSVIAVCKLSNDLFPDHEASVTAVSVSVGLMNLVGCWFGAMPVCHGAGGLAGQYRFGGRTGASVVLLGVGKLVLGLLFGNSFVRILNQFPVGILGALLLFAGIELAMASKDMNTKEESFSVDWSLGVCILQWSSAALGGRCLGLCCLYC